MGKINIKEIYDILFKKYGPQGWWPVYSLRNTEGRDDRGYYIGNVPVGTDRDLRLHRRAGSLLPTSLSLRESSIFEIAIGAVLTQNTAWTNVEKAIDNLINLSLLDPKIILEICKDDLADAIRPSGYYNQKAKKLKILIRFLLDGGFLEDGNIPDRGDLLELWGIGKETVDSILLYAYRIHVFVIDTYTRRIFERVGILRGSESYKEIAGNFIDSLEKDFKVYQEYHALIVRHAKEHCRKKPLCDGGVLNEICIKKSKELNS